MGTYDLDKELNENYVIAERAYQNLGLGKRYFYIKDDLIQEAVLRLLQERNNYNPYKSKYTTWAKRVAMNCMINYLAHETYEPKSILQEDQGEDLQLLDVIASDDKTPEEIEYWQMLKREIRKYLGRVPEQTKKIIVMHLKHYKQGIISQEIGVNQSVVSTTITTFRKWANEFLR